MGPRQTKYLEVPLKNGFFLERPNG